MHIANIEKLPLSTTGSPLLIRCKTFLSVTFVIPKDSECHDVYTSLMKLYQPGKWDRHTNMKVKRNYVLYASIIIIFFMFL